MNEELVGKIFIEKFTRGTVKVTDVFQEDGQKLVQCESTHSNVGLIMTVGNFLNDFRLENESLEQREEI